MEIKVILSSLSQYNPTVLVENGLPAYIESYKILQHRQLHFSPACVYIGMASDLPNVLPDEYANLICIQNADIPDIFKHAANVNLYLLPPETDLLQIINHIADLMMDESTVTMAMRRMLDVLYNNSGLQALVDTASEIFENPFFIADSTYKLLAVPRNINSFDDTITRGIGSVYIRDSDLHSMMQDNIFRKMRRDERVLFSRDTRSGLEWLFRTVKLHNIAVADIAIVNTVRPFRTLDYELLERVSKLVAIELQKNDLYKATPEVMYNYLMNDILNESFQTHAEIVKRASLLGWKMNQHFQIAVLSDRSKGYLRSKIPYIGSQMRQLIPDCHWTAFEENFVVFLSRSSRHILSEHEFQALSSFLADNDLIAGLSDVFCSVDKAVLYYHQALDAMRCGPLIIKSETVFLHRDMIAYRLANHISSNSDLREYISSELVFLQEYDEINNSRLLETLEKYLYYVDDPGTAAQSLHIHKNTLFYRINKIKDLTALALHDGDERLRLQLGLKFLKWQQQ